MRYLPAVLSVLAFCFLVGCGERAPQQSSGKSKADDGRTAAERGMPGRGTGIGAAREGGKWTIKHRVPLIDEPREFGDREEFQKHLVSALPRGTAVTVLENREGAWLKVRASTDDGRQNGWISANNILRAEKVPQGQVR